MAHKFDKIYRLGKQQSSTFKPDDNVVIQEKIDGANFRVWVDEKNNLRFGSRTVEFLPDSDPNCSYGIFTDTVNYIKSLNTQHFAPGHIYYFEAMIKHTLPYDFDKHPKAILIDIYSVELDGYYNYHDVTYCAAYIGCDVAPVVFNGNFGDWDKVIPQSKFGNFQAEGVVIKPFTHTRDTFGNRVAAKMVTEKFKEENREVFGGTNDWESAFAKKYTTQARIEKHIKQLEVAKNEKFNLEWIPIISYNLTYDICIEEFKKLLKKQTPNLQTIRCQIERELKLYLSQRGKL